jgi:hypothetical protein
MVLFSLSTFLCCIITVDFLVISHPCTVGIKTLCGLCVELVITQTLDNTHTLCTSVAPSVKEGVMRAE